MNKLRSDSHEENKKEEPVQSNLKKRIDDDDDDSDVSLNSFLLLIQKFKFLGFS